MKIKVFVSFVMIFFLFFLTVSADTLDEEYVRQYELCGANELSEQLPEDVTHVLSQWGLSMDTPNFDINTSRIFSSVIEYITSTLTSPLRSVGMILTILTLCALFLALSNGDRQKEIISYISAIIMCGAIILPISDLIEKSEVAISLCCGFNITLIPIYSGILLASGSVKSLASGNVLFFISQGIEFFISSIFPSLVGIYTSVSICSSLNIYNNLSHLSATIKKIIDWVLGIVVTLYTAIITVTGLITSVSDSVGQRTGKFIISSSIPIVGGVISDSFGAILGALKYLKSGIGLYALCAVIILLLPVVFEAILWRYVLLLSSGVADMLGQDVGAELLRSISNGVGIILSVVISISLVLLISLAVVVIGGISI